MAEAIAVIGVVSSIVQLIDFTSSVFHRLDDFQSSLGDVPKSLQHLKAQLPVLQHVLEQTSKAIDAGSVKSEVQKLLIPVIEGCTEQIKLLEGILAKVLLMPTESRLRRGAKAILSLYQDDKLDSITKILHSYVGTLTLYYAGTSSTLQPLTGITLSINIKHLC
jgi:hypothetical protein